MYSLHGEDCGVEVTGSSSGQQQHAFSNYGCDTIELVGWTKFKKSLNERAMRFLEDPELQYLAVENVSTSDVEQIDNLRRRGDLPQLRILYDEEMKLMIVKLTFGVPHGGVTCLFDQLFCELVPPSTGIFTTRSTRFGGVNGRHKEADQSYVPTAVRRPNRDWPSVVVEVGVFESLHQLQEDARFWLIESAGQVHVVILICIGLSSADMRWERWEHIPSVEPATQSHAVHINPTLMQFVTLPVGGPVIGAPFRIPSDKIWDIVPNNVGPEIVISAQRMQALSKTFDEQCYD